MKAPPTTTRANIIRLTQGLELLVQDPGSVDVRLHGPSVGYVPGYPPPCDQAAPALNSGCSHAYGIDTATRRWILKSLPFPSIGAAIIRGAAAASAQGLPASRGANTDPAWSIGQHAQRPDAPNRDHVRGLIEPFEDSPTNDAFTCTHQQDVSAAHTVAGRAVR